MTQLPRFALLSRVSSLVPRSSRRAAGWLTLVALSQLGMHGRGCEVEPGTGAGGGGSGGSAGAAGTGSGGASGVCVVDGQVHQVGESFPSSDGCNTCSCTETGDAVCTLRACAAPVCGGLTGAACGDGEFCSFPPEAQCGAADQTGICVERPEACDLQYQPVCGCDDRTYGNACEAALAGVSVSREGECEAGGEPECASDDDCPQVDCACFDDNGDNRCDNPCPVFGCRGGQCVDVSRRSCGGLTGAGCDDGEFCSFPPEAQCGAADQTGVCAPKPEACTLQFDPVCGCDDHTYGNACEAASAGVSVAFAGRCSGECSADSDCPIPPCICLDENTDGVCENTCPVPVCIEGECRLVDPTPSLGLGDGCGGFRPAGSPDCGPGLFCQHQPGALCGAADAPGVCVEVPSECPESGDAVCGCDGQTYASACHAALDRVGILDAGACP